MYDQHYIQCIYINRSSYPDSGETPMETGENEDEEVVSENVLDTEGYELVLPSGEALGIIQTERGGGG